MNKLFIVLVSLLSIKIYGKIDPMSPQIHAGNGFEGWYTKVDTLQRSVAVIVGTKFSKNGLSKGMVTILISEKNKKTQHFEIFPMNPMLGRKNENFLWKTRDENVVFGRDKIEINDPLLPKIKVSMNKHSPWSNVNNFGPEGLMLKNPFLFSHWYVFSTKSNASIYLELNGTEYREIGYAHLEKNWGDKFPRSWIWSQGRDLPSSLSFSFAGGRAPLKFGVKFDVWALNISHKSKNYIFNHKFSSLNTKVKTDCEKYFKFKSKDREYEVELSVTTEPEEFIPIYGILKNQWEVVAKESFKSIAYIKIVKQNRIILEHQISDSVMEFGGVCINKK